MLLLVAVAVAQAWVAYASMVAKQEFEDFLLSHPFKTKVTRSSYLEGPVDALFLSPTVRLVEPTEHQRWWGLVPAAHIDLVESDVEKLLSSRHWIWFFAVLGTTLTCWQLYNAVMKTSFLNPLSVTSVYGALINAGLATMVNAAVQCSMFGIYFDAELGLPVVNYVPGWVYINFLTSLLLMAFMVVTTPCLVAVGGKSAMVLFGLMVAGLFIYFVFWLAIPMMG